MAKIRNKGSFYRHKARGHPGHLAETPYPYVPCGKLSLEGIWMNTPFWNLSLFHTCSYMYELTIIKYTCWMKQHNKCKHNSQSHYNYLNLIPIHAKGWTYRRLSAYLCHFNNPHHMHLTYRYSGTSSFVQGWRLIALLCHFHKSDKW